MSENIAELGREIVEIHGNTEVRGGYDGLKDTLVEMDESNWIFRASNDGLYSHELPSEWSSRPNFKEAKLYFHPQSDGGQIWLFRERTHGNDGRVIVSDGYVQVTVDGKVIGEQDTIGAIDAGVRKLRQLDAAKVITSFLEWELNYIQNEKRYIRGAAMDGRLEDGVLASPWPAPKGEKPVSWPAPNPTLPAEAHQ